MVDFGATFFDSNREALYQFSLGFLGGSCVAVLGILLALHRTTSGTNDERISWFRLMVSGALAVVAWGCLGGVVTWALEGRAGLFVTGLTSVALVAALGRGSMLEELEEGGTQ